MIHYFTEVVKCLDEVGCKTSKFNTNMVHESEY